MHDIIFVFSVRDVAVDAAREINDPIKVVESHSCSLAFRPLLISGFVKIPVN